MRKISVIGAEESVKQFMSRRSVIGTMDNFVQAVDNMNETVMIPSLLMDLSFNGEQNGSTDMHSFYSLLNTVRSELLFGSGNNNNNNKVQQSSCVEGRRRPSVRRMSSASSTSSDSSDIDYFSESIMSESELSSLEADEESCTRLTRDFQHHLIGLCRSLKHLTQSAQTLTTRYRAEVESNKTS